MSITLACWPKYLRLAKYSEKYRPGYLLTQSLLLFSFLVNVCSFNAGYLSHIRLGNNARIILWIYIYIVGSALRMIPNAERSEQSMKISRNDLTASVGVLAGRSAPVGFNFTDGYSNMDLNNKEYPQVEPRFLICILFVLYTKEYMFVGEPAVLEIRIQSNNI